MLLTCCPKGTVLRLGQRTTQPAPRMFARPSTRIARPARPCAATLAGPRLSRYQQAGQKGGTNSAKQPGEEHSSRQPYTTVLPGVHGIPRTYKHIRGPTCSQDGGTNSDWYTYRDALIMVAHQLGLRDAKVWNGDPKARGIMVVSEVGVRIACQLADFVPAEILGMEHLNKLIERAQLLAAQLYNKMRSGIEAGVRGISAVLEMINAWGKFPAM